LNSPAADRDRRRLPHVNLAESSRLGHQALTHEADALPRWQSDAFGAWNWRRRLMSRFTTRSAASIVARLAILAVAVAVAPSSGAWAALVISQYVETNSGTFPKGIEVWNSGTATIDFASQNLQIGQGTNGGALSLLGSTLITSGTLAADDVLVLGTADMGTYLTGQGLGSVRFVSYSFSFNGDDPVGLYLGGNLVDLVGEVGPDPGTGWSGNGVATFNQNIELREGITTGDPSGWTDPSVRFQTVSIDPVGTNGLAGFGIAPVPEPSTVVLAGLGLASLAALAARRLRRGTL